MSPSRRQRDDDREERLREAEGAAETIDDREKATGRQLSLVGKLTVGWRKVHEINHLAQLFSDEGRLG
jgi:hypothetical protein